MMPIARPNGKILVPRRAEADGAVGDGMVEIGPDDPEYAVWAEHLKQRAVTMVSQARAKKGSS